MYELVALFSREHRAALCPLVHLNTPRSGTAMLPSAHVVCVSFVASPRLWESPRGAVLVERLEGEGPVVLVGSNRGAGEGITFKAIFPLSNEGEVAVGTLLVLHAESRLVEAVYGDAAQSPQLVVHDG